MSDAIIWGIIAAACLVGVIVARKTAKDTTGAFAKKGAQATPDYQHIMNGYTELLEEKPPVSSLLYDVDTLPFPKESIKEACLWAIKQTNDEQTLEALKFSYVRLANYQENIQRELRENGIEAYYGLVEPDSIEMEKYLQWLQFHQERMPIVNKEMAALSDDLKGIA